MSTIKSSAENLTLNADGANNDIIFQSNGSNVATLDQAGVLTATSFAGSGASLTGISSVGGATGVDFNDNVKARFGTGNDLEIYHDGSDSIIADTGVGDLLISGSGTVRIDGSGETMINCTDDGAVSLYFNNAVKLATTLKGVQATGTMAVGSTPLELYSGYSGFQVGSNGFIFGQHAAGADKNLWLSQNSWADGSGNEVAISTGKVSSLHQSSGKFSFKVATTTTANANITWVTPFKICHQSVSGGDWSTEMSQTAEGSGTVYYMNIKTGGAQRGSIMGDGSNVSFNTSSDYRLKENVDYDWDATTRLKQLKPARFNFIEFPDKTVDGFIAHEVSSVVPEAISGEKDAMTTDDDDNAVIAPQGIDQSKLVPLLVKTIQELEARITALEA